MPEEKIKASDIEQSHFRRSAANRPRLMDGGIKLDEIENVRVAIYTRVSKEEQAEEGYSLAAQQNACREFCESRNWTIIDVYEDAGFSAKDDNRPAFQRMIADATERKFNTVLVHKLDRFSRSIEHTLSYFKLLSANEVALTSVSEKFDFSSAQGRLFFRMMAIFAQWYLENLSAEAVKGKDEMFRQGIHNGAPPFGYAKVDGQIEVVPEEAEAVRMAFELAASGTYTHRMIADILNKKFRTRRGNGWSKDTVTSMLRNEFYFGMVAHRDQIRPGKHAAIISRELFDKTQEATRHRARTPRSFLFKKHSKTGRPVIITEEQSPFYMLQRIIRCNACGRPLRVQTAKVLRYYREVSGDRGLSCEFSGKTVRMDKADQAVIDLLGKLRLPPGWQEEIRRRAKDKDVLAQSKARKADLEDKIRRLDAVYLNGSYEHIVYQEQREKLLDELNRLVIPDQASTFEYGMVLENLSVYLVRATPSELSDLCRAILDAVYTDFVDHRIVRFKPSPEFIELFRVAAQESGWQEIASGDFQVMRNT